MAIGVHQKENNVRGTFSGRYSRHFLVVLLITVGMSMDPSPLKAQHTLGIQGTHFTLDRAPFDYTGISFFNALYNPAFNNGNQSRLYWLKKFKNSGITVVRVWAEWNNDLGFVDACDSCTLFYRNGTLRPQYLSRLDSLLMITDSLKMVVELVLFSSESFGKRLSDKAADRAVKNITNKTRSYRNMAFQIWNERDYRIWDYFTIIKRSDIDRIVTNSPGGGGSLGSDTENAFLDYLSPHTSRQGKHWERAPNEIRSLLQKFSKPVVDDEPARTGTRKFGGPEADSYPYDQILHIYNVWKVGGYVTYHHDMFQTGYGSNAIPPNGIPYPDFSPYHKAVFRFLAQKERYE